jgi:Cu(I)/Ag(I) efflux system membrane protein CusA/SilA
VEFWSRSRLSGRTQFIVNLLPEGINPALGPDATGLGQIFWYTLEGRDQDSMSQWLGLAGTAQHSRYYVKYGFIIC